MENKTLLEMMQDGNRLFGDSYHYWLETEFGMPTGYHVTKEEVKVLLNGKKIVRIFGGNKDFYRVSNK